MTKLQKLKNSISSYKRNCDGYGNPSGNGNYVLGFLLEVGKVSKRLGHDGSSMLDEINAFDMAERNGTYLGQINMSIVSSFCGPQGLIWGYDIAVHDRLKNGSRKTDKYVSSPNGNVPVYSLRPMLEATQKLLGTVDTRQKRYPLIPGSHVPCAGKNIKLQGPVTVYAAAAIGIAKDRNRDACLLMEDIGTIDIKLKGNQLHRYREMILNKVAESVIQVGINQKVEFEEIFVGMTDEYASSEEIACALVAAPYLTLAKDAVKPFLINGGLDISLSEWEKTLNSN